MPNWCSTDIMFYGEQKQVQALLQTLEAIRNNPQGGKSDFGNGWLGHIVKHFDLNPEIRHRGSIIDIYEHSDDAFMVTCEDAWAPMVELWRAVIEHFPEVSFDIRAEEPGCGLYLNTDTSGVYFPDRFLVELDYDYALNEEIKQIAEAWPIRPGDREFYENEKDLLDDMSRFFDMHVEDMEVLNREIEIFNETYEEKGLALYLRIYEDSIE